MVVQCPTCQSKFRIADDKVTEKGVRVRCTSCRNVFQVRRPGAAGADAGPGPGETMDLSSLSATAPVARPGSQKKAATARPTTDKLAAARAASSRPAPVRSANGAAARLDVDDLFGMAELTGDAPPPAPPAAKPAPAKAAASFDDLDLELDDRPRAPPAPPDLEDDEPAPAAKTNGAAVADDPFDDLSLAEPAPKKPEPPPPPPPRREKPPTGPVRVAAPPPQPVEVPFAKVVLSSALTGLVAAALAVVALLVFALSNEGAAAWLGLRAAGDLVATRVVSGLYDTVAGKPVFYVRGRVENRSTRAHGPVRVTAELIGDGPEAKAEAIAGAEPSPEDVWGLRNAGDAEKLGRALETASVERRVQPGASLPFFALFADPPADLSRHRLNVRVEAVDAWRPAVSRGGAKGK